MQPNWQIRFVQAHLRKCMHPELAKPRKLPKITRPFPPLLLRVESGDETRDDRGGLGLWVMRNNTLMWNLTIIWFRCINDNCFCWWVSHF